MDGRTVAIVAIFVSLAGGEVQRAGDLFVKKNVAHRIEDVGVESKGKLAGVACTWIGVQDFVEAFGIVRSGFDDFSGVEDEANVLELSAGVESRGVELNVAFDGVSDGT